MIAFTALAVRAAGAFFEPIACFAPNATRDTGYDVQVLSLVNNNAFNSLKVQLCLEPVIATGLCTLPDSANDDAPFLRCEQGGVEERHGWVPPASTMHVTVYLPSNTTGAVPPFSPSVALEAQRGNRFLLSPHSHSPLPSLSSPPSLSLSLPPSLLHTALFHHQPSKSSRSPTPAGSSRSACRRSSRAAAASR